MTTSTIILNLIGPMQYWASGSGVRERFTNSHPTKSAVIGLVANALGRSYDDSIDDLAELRFAVTIDQPGNLEKDFKTAGTVDYLAFPGDTLFGSRVKTTGSRPIVSGLPNKNPDYSTVKTGTLGIPQAQQSDPKLVYEHYLADAQFRVALSGNKDLIESIYDALVKPARPIYLGRRSYSPSRPVVDNGSVQHCDLYSAISDWKKETHIECAPGTPGSNLVPDQPVSFGSRSKRAWRAEIVRNESDIDFSRSKEGVSHYALPNSFATRF